MTEIPEARLRAVAPVLREEMKFFRQAEVLIRSCDDDLMRRMFLESFLVHFRVFALDFGTISEATLWMLECIGGCDRLLRPMSDEGAEGSRWEGDAMAVLGQMARVERLWSEFLDGLTPERREWFR